MTPDPDWPEFGTLDGAPVRLADVEATVPRGRWADVIVTFPPEHRRLGGLAFRPWRAEPPPSPGP